MSWGGFADKVMGFFTPDQIAKRRRETLASLQKRRAEILKMTPSIKLSAELTKIDARISEIKDKLGA